MTNLPPSGPRSPQRNPLDFDEFIGLIVAFTTIGAIIFWSFSRRETGFNLGQLLPTPTPTPNIEQTPPANPNNLLPGLSTQTNPDGVTLPVIPPVGKPQQDSTNILPLPLPLPGVDNEQKPELSAPVPNTSGAPFQVTTPVAVLPVTPPPRAFTDVPDNFWARRFIDVLSSRKIIEGFKDYTFRPDQPITRAEFAAIIERAFNKEIGQTKLAFTDVPGNYWATGAINDAIGTGFLKGYPDKTFKPEQKIPRVQVLVALVSGLGLKSPAAPDKVVNIYSDTKDIPKYAIDRVAAATQEGLVVNYPDRNAFAPNREATRAEVAAMIHQALVRTGRLPAIKSDNIVQVK
ncbi:S-layer domain-containing protein [Calothrix sp. NIES-4071]|nr:S-layer domain-containing protein [Calothrix sp. NIES-4071]BAZ62069.1 S-layer domain-containing protein [Calothrix sp. NIES-4105]